MSGVTAEKVRCDRPINSNVNPACAHSRSAREDEAKDGMKRLAATDRLVAPIINSTNPDLSDFKSLGGKLIDLHLLVSGRARGSAS